MATGRPRRILGELLIEKGLLNKPDLERARTEQKRTGELMGAVLMRLKLITSEQLMAALAEQVSMPCIRLTEVQVTPEALSKVAPQFASQYTVLPLSFSNGMLEVAIADPFDVQTLDELKLLLNCEINPVLASEQEIHQAIERHYGLGASSVAQLVDAGMAGTQPVSTVEDLTDKAEEASVASFVNRLILTAVRDRATDIHVEPFEQQSRIRQRIDGVLYDIPVPPGLAKLHQAIVSRIKVMAKLDIAERRLPQDGRIKVRLEDQDLDLRISVLPTGYGESVNIRLLSSSMLISLEDLGLSSDQLQILEQLIKKPHGIVFVTGPTGSGKTTTLYACLTKLNTPNRKILTIEDPVEYQLRGITQLQVHPKIGLSFAHGLRSMLRHDPDIMMVGEVRDPETAEITIRSALTGHLVFSTLHTNDGAGGVTRLLDMGIESYLVASSVLCFIAQRLVRVICGSCQEERKPDERVLKELGLPEPLPSSLRYGKGCRDCKQTGFKGRTAIYEFLMVDDSIRQLVLRKASADEIAKAAQEQGGMRSLRQDGFRKVLAGVTTAEEVLRVS